MRISLESQNWTEKLGKGRGVNGQLVPLQLANTKSSELEALTFFVDWMVLDLALCDSSALRERTSSTSS